MNFLKTFYQHFKNDLWSSVTMFGSPIFYLFLILFLIKTDHLLAIKLIILLAAVEIFCWAIKILYKKDRPAAQSRENLIARIDANSFPSIHAARISALAIYLNSIYQSGYFMAVGLLMILLVGYSRIFLKKHDTKDVLGGFLIGVLMAAAALLF